MSAKILMIRGGAIGDFILTLPVLAALRVQFPAARLEVLGYAHIAGLASEGGLADAVRSIEAAGLAGFFAKDGRLNDELADYFSGFALIISYLYDPDGVFQANVRRCSEAQFIQGPHRPDEQGGRAAARVFLEPLTRLAIFDPDPVPRLCLGEARERTTGSVRKLMLHPGSGSERKNWPEERWRELLGRLIGETNWRLLVASGEAEGDKAGRLTAALPAERLELLHNRPLPELGRAFEQCDSFVGHDSGISHLAAAVGLPGWVLWGESMEEVWRPPSDRVVVVRHPGGLLGLGVDEVFEQLRSAERAV